MDPRDISRRDFLTTVAASSLGAAVPAAELKSDRKIRIGVVGGGFGASFQWPLDPNCEVAAVSDLDPARSENYRTRTLQPQDFSATMGFRLAT
jgi:hypothetical protein